MAQKHMAPLSPLIISQQSLRHDYVVAKLELEEAEKRRELLKQEKEQSLAELKNLADLRDRMKKEEMEFIQKQKKRHGEKRSIAGQMKALHLHSGSSCGDVNVKIQAEQARINSCKRSIERENDDIACLKETLAGLKLQLTSDSHPSFAEVVKKPSSVECVKSHKRLLFDQHKTEAVTEASKSICNVEVKGKGVVHEASGLQDSGHVLEDYEVSKQVTGRKRSDETKSHLAPVVLELVKMLFNVEAYRNAMMEFQIDLSEMPLGKLTKNNIQKGFEALTEIQNLLKGNSDSSEKESLLVHASNRFFSVIPSTHPHVIRDVDDFLSKVKMLEALQEIEIALKLVGFNGDDDETFDDKYEKLRCNIKPLPRDSDDYKLVEKYLRTTHSPAHLDWDLELEDVFTLERAGELEQFTQLKNHMLLWHGSRLTNFVGILSQGLRIAPPEAPATCYMFGKGVYFTDLVSKSAQCCFTDKNNPVGLLLLTEVALGEVYELKKASYMDKPPKGRHSTKGLGKKVPQESEHVIWRDDVGVPCGKPVSKRVRASELMCNEYIVYDSAQVKLQFLLKVRFHYKSEIG